MDERGVELEVEGRAAAMADWLRERLAERPAWLASELDIAARAAGFDTETWRYHPGVSPLIESRLLRLPWCSRPLAVVTARDAAEGPCDENELSFQGATTEGGD